MRTSKLGMLYDSVHKESRTLELTKALESYFECSIKCGETLPISFNLFFSEVWVNVSQEEVNEVKDELKSRGLEVEFSDHNMSVKLLSLS